VYGKAEALRWLFACLNRRNDGSWACRTAQEEIECYLHGDAIRAAYGVAVEVLDHPPTKADSVGNRFGQTYSELRGYNGVMREDKAKNISQ
jgi:hypothetical protein